MENIKFEQKVVRGSGIVNRLVANFDEQYKDLPLVFEYIPSGKGFVGFFFIGAVRQAMFLFDNHADVYHNEHNVRAWLIGLAYPFLAE